MGRVYIEQGCAIEKELYFSLLVDRASSRITAIASEAGGMDIEEVAAETPEKIIKISIDPLVGFQPFHARQIAFKLGLEGKSALKAASLFCAACECFEKYDAGMIEINPLAVTTEGDVLALDAKMVFDDNALFRHSNLETLRDLKEEDPAEIEAARHSLSYIKLDGNIGCLVNGAGLAMATMT